MTLLRRLTSLTGESSGDAGGGGGFGGAGGPRPAPYGGYQDPAGPRSEAGGLRHIGGSPYVDGILREPFALDAEGYLQIPELPGLGVELDPDKVARYTDNAASLFNG